MRTLGPSPKATSITPARTDAADYDTHTRTRTRSRNNTLTTA
ncbi:hypothetical protein [Catenulispora pinistramenti]|nr:hypothetical protein [Catenulispora pinistramenti]